MEKKINLKLEVAFDDTSYSQDKWEKIFDLFQQPGFSIDQFLMGRDFFSIAKEVYDIKYSQIVFSDYLWTLRSIYLPLFLVLKTKVPKADLYHCVATGYAGVLGSMAQYFHKSSLMISEHGIYTREREEELIRATWVEGKYPSPSSGDDRLRLSLV